MSVCIHLLPLVHLLTLKPLHLKQVNQMIRMRNIQFMPRHIFQGEYICVLCMRSRYHCFPSELEMVWHIWWTLTNIQSNIYFYIKLQEYERVFMLLSHHCAITLEEIVLDGLEFGHWPLAILLYLHWGLLNGAQSFLINSLSLSLLLSYSLPFRLWVFKCLYQSFMDEVTGVSSIHDHQASKCCHLLIMTFHLYIFIFILTSDALI